MEGQSVRRLRPRSGKALSLLPPKNHAWIPPILSPKDSAYDDWLNYGHQAPGVVHKVFAAPIALWQRVVFTWGPLLAVIFLVGLGGWFAVTGRRRGTGGPGVCSAQGNRPRYAVSVPS